ncbi:MAG: HAD family hydrolase [Candidatus Bipolaricaulaceae bacterium]
MIRAILLDLGGPVFDEDAEYTRWTEILLLELSKNGFHVSPEEFQGALLEELRNCEPNPWLSALWRFVRPDLLKFRAILKVFRVQNQVFQENLPGVRIRPEALEVVPRLAGRYRLALAANQPPRALTLLEEAGLLRHFCWRNVSDTMGIAKPSPLFFRMILDGLDVKPAEAIMVGDRLDHDVFPAKLLGMRTVRVLLGPYRHQRPPTPLHSPHLSVSDLFELEEVLKGMG